MAEEDYCSVLEEIAETLLQIMLNMLSIAKIEDKKKAIKYILTALGQYTKKIR